MGMGGTQATQAEHSSLDLAIAHAFALADSTSPRSMPDPFSDGRGLETDHSRTYYVASLSEKDELATAIFRQWGLDQNHLVTYF